MAGVAPDIRPVGLVGTVIGSNSDERSRRLPTGPPCG
jgi:hypothetical protein